MNEYIAVDWGSTQLLMKYRFGALPVQTRDAAGQLQLVDAFAITHPPCPQLGGAPIDGNILVHDYPLPA